MKHRNLKNEEWTLMAIDSLFERGVRGDWEEFVAALRRDPQLARDTLKMCEHHANFESANLARVLIRHIYHSEADLGLDL